ncbi:MAG TPA: type II toxin-antitoxin system RelE/ParE family toxin [Ilumatobacteraceae bacterium]|nr:type II toxin-antitoxin system RelE/ParE family toxin [Ilumatobacteraceae bacterium]
MSLNVSFHELARSDLYSAWIWYEEQRTGLGDQFSDAVDSVLRRIARWPNSGSPTLHNERDQIVERKLPTPGFPYVIRYRLIGDAVMVMAVSHQHRHPVAETDRE